MSRWSMANRRDFLKILGVGGAAGLTSCSNAPPRSLVPYVVAPEETVKGHALWFSTTCRECPAGCGVRVRVREGRVHKVEGNPLHPVNGGGLCARGQASVQGLYNPDRLRTPLARDARGALRPISWAEAEKRLAAALGKLPARPGAVGVMTGVTGPAMRELVRLCLASWNSARHIVYEPFSYETLREANRLSFGLAALPVYRFADARAIHVFSAGVIETFLSPVGNALGIREARSAGGRLIYTGSRLSLTAAHADQFVRVSPESEGLVAMALVRELLAQGGGAHLAAGERARLAAWSAPFTADKAGIPEQLVRELAGELRAKAALAVTGGPESDGRNGVATALAVNLLNVATGAVNKTLRFERTSALGDAVSAPDISGLDALFLVETNPVYSSPGFLDGLRKVPLVVAIDSFSTETTEAAHLVLPAHTPLESWGDAEPWTGLHCLQQPAMRPVFDTREPGDILLGAAKPKTPEPNFREFLRARWRALHQESDSKDDFESFWAACLQRGGGWAEAADRPVNLTSEDLGPRLAPLLARTQPAAGSYRLETYPSISHFDGRSANRPWLQELPDPITQIVWDSWLEMNPGDARKLGLATGDRARVSSAGASLELPVYVYPGIQPGAVAIPLGQGHTAFGRYATGVGVNAMALPGAAAGRPRVWSGEPVRIERLAAKHELVTVAGHDLQLGRGIARSRSVPELAREHGPHEGAGEHLSLYKPHLHKDHRWGMVIDLNACNGCSACVTACYAENNIPVVGKEEAGRGREMSWIRLERFFAPGRQIADPPRLDFTLMLCQQCDNAPCEPVCPVFASYHTQEGLNGQVYNRCVGTRYCSNNCPYKVRRFNWYPGAWPAPLDWQLNPDVTVRSKGVMEKCTFCVQRITEAKDRARRENRPLADGDVVPACAQSCPVRAITFGDLMDPKSRVSRLASAGGRYRVFEELNTRPAVTYLERERRRA